MKNEKLIILGNSGIPSSIFKRSWDGMVFQAKLNETGMYGKFMKDKIYQDTDEQGFWLIDKDIKENRYLMIFKGGVWKSDCGKLVIIE